MLKIVISSELTAAQSWILCSLQVCLLLREVIYLPMNLNLTFLECYCYETRVICNPQPHGRSAHSLSVSHPPLSPPKSIASNRSPPCIQGLSARRGGGQRWRETEMYYWWCSLMTVESCSGPHERTLLDNVCGCNFLRGRRGGVQHKTT